jgi:hypothetical protein
MGAFTGFYKIKGTAFLTPKDLAIIAARLTMKKHD